VSTSRICSYDVASATVRTQTSSLVRPMRVRLGLDRSMVRARDRRIQRSEHAIRVLAINPDMPVEVGLDMCASSSAVLGSSAIGSNGTLWNVGRSVCPAPRHASANTRFSTATRFERSASLGLVDQNARLPEVRVRTGAANPWRWWPSDAEQVRPEEVNAHCADHVSTPVLQAAVAAALQRLAPARAARRTRQSSRLAERGADAAQRLNETRGRRGRAAASANRAGAANGLLAIAPFR
jgi:hypothetical protein